MTEIRNRLLDFIDFLDIEKSVFERNCSLSNGFVDKAGNNTRSSSLRKISMAYPQLNISWLKSGAGNMIKDEFRELSIEDQKKSIHDNSKAYRKIIMSNHSLSENYSSYNTVNIELPSNGEIKIIDYKGEEIVKKESFFEDSCQKITILENRIKDLEEIILSKDQALEAMKQLVEALRGN